MGNEQYITLFGNSTAELTEKKSRFIAIAMRVENEADALAEIERQRKLNRDARHVCYAYSIEGRRSVRASDDGEPSGTAGVPILDLIKKRDLDNVLVIVIRYFGGILLGAPGLVRAYSGVAKEALDNAVLAKYCIASEMVCRCSYSEYEKLRSLLERNDAYGISVEFAEDVSVSFKCVSVQKEALSLKVAEAFGGRISLEFSADIAELKKI